MATNILLIKSLAAAAATGIATSQSASAGVPLTLNGAAAARLSTTAAAAAKLNATFIQLASVTGAAVGQSVTDSTSAVLAPGTKVTAVNSNGIQIWPPVGGAGVGNSDTIVLSGAAIIDAASATNVAIGRRVVLAYTGTDTSFVIVGTNSTGNVITDTAVGAAGAAVSNLDFVTVTSITPVGGGLTGLTAGTSGVGSSPWVSMNLFGYSPENITAIVELVSGSANYTVEYTLDDPNNLGALAFPLALSDLSPAALIAASATKDGLFNFPLVALRLTINSGTGVLRARFGQAGIG